MSRSATLARVAELKEADEDRSWYPTTDEIIGIVADDIEENSYGYSDRTSSIMDIGAGDGRVLIALNERLKERHNGMDLLAIEIATPHLRNMPDGVSIVGTDFWQQTLIDKPVSCIFCNPPYSDFKRWTIRILREATAKSVYLVIPERWSSDKDIAEAIAARGDSEVLGSFDFQDADRQARAKVNVVRVQFSHESRDAFDSIIEEMLPELDVFDEDLEDDEDDDKPRDFRNLIAGGSVIESMVESYNNDIDQLRSNYSAALKLERSILKELGVCKSGVLTAIRGKIKGLKTLYWNALFEHLKTVTSRLATKQRKAFLSSLNEKLSVDFTEMNIHAVLIRVVKWANEHLDDQLIDLFRTLSTKSNVEKYKSNQNVWTEVNWRYRAWEDGNPPTHFKLDYRIVVSHGGIDTGWDGKEDRGLSESARELLSDIVTVANNLHFECSDSHRNYRWSAGKRNDLMLKDGEPLVAVRAHKNGNLHLRFNPKFMLAVNVEAGRLLGWIRNPSEACDEMDIKNGDVEAVKKLFGSSFRIGPSQLRLGMSS